MSEENKEFVRRWFEMLGQPDWPEHIADFVAPEVDALILASFIPFRAAFPDYQFIIDTMVAEDDIVMVFGRASGTFAREYPFDDLKGIAPTGTKLEWQEATWIRVIDGRFVDGRLIVDGVSRLQQIGALPSR